MLQQPIHETLKKVRKTCKISQVRIGTLLGLNQAGVSRIENGSQQVSIDWLILLSKFYHVDLESLISGRVNYWELAKRFNVKVPLPTKYQQDQQAIVREILPLLSYFSELYEIHIVKEFLKELGLEDILLIDPNSRISILCIYDIINLAIEKRLISHAEINNVVALAFNSLDQAPFNSIYKNTESASELIHAWVLNSTAYEGMFSHKVESTSPGEQLISLKICDELQNKDFKTHQMDQYLLKYKTSYLETLPLHFGHKAAQVNVIENPFHTNNRSGLLRLTS